MIELKDGELKAVKEGSLIIPDSIENFRSGKSY